MMRSVIGASKPVCRGPKWCVRTKFATEVAVDPPPPTDAGLLFIGRIRTPRTDRLKTPRQDRPDGPVCRMEIFDP